MTPKRRTYAEGAPLPGPPFPVLTRASHDRRRADGRSKLCAAADGPERGRRTVSVPVGPKALRHGLEQCRAMVVGYSLQHVCIE